jgi:histidine triad (HIT) family protein
MECPFCKIVKGELNAYKVYEDEKFLAFLSIRPVTDGHVLVIPKEHIRWVWDVPNIDEYYKVVRKIAQALRKAFNTEQILSYVLGDEVPHAHVWLLPKLESDSLEDLMNIRKTKHYTPEKFKEVAERIRRFL